MNTLGMIAIVVDEYDLAISHYVNDLGFTLIEDKELAPEKRWVVVSPSKNGAKILLAKATNEKQTAAIGNSTGGRVGFFLYTTNFSETNDPKPMIAGETSKNQVKYSFGLIPERISPIKKNRM